MTTDFPTINADFWQTTTAPSEDTATVGVDN
jgi:hypothetical protein